MSERHHYVQGWGLRLVCSGCCDADRHGCLCVWRCGLVQGGRLPRIVGGWPRPPEVTGLTFAYWFPRYIRSSKACWIFVRLSMLSPSAGTLSGRPSPARLEQGEQIVAGSHNIRTEGMVGGGQPAGLNCPRQFLFARSEGNIATSHSICGAFVIKRDSSDGLLEVTDAAVRRSV